MWNRLFVHYYILGLIFLVNSFIVSGCSSKSISVQPDIPVTSFDAKNAFTILVKQCEFGPRPVGTPAHDQTRLYLIEELKKYARSVEMQDFNYTLAGKSQPLSNIIARFGSTSANSILLSAHWDTRPTADRETDLSKRQTPIIGANDGASGVAVLLELARMFHDNPPVVPVTIVLFDGEDYGPTGDDMFIGSRYFASKLPKPTGYRYGILLDMIGDKDLGIYREGNSQISAKPVVDKIWNTARGLGYSRYFINSVKFTIIDDHIPLIEAGLPCADVIDFDYRPWHTTADTIDKCSPESLKVVGDTISKLVYSER
ncbi:MAG: M28 family peptidase [Armatimonadota bacterium]